VIPLLLPNNLTLLKGFAKKARDMRSMDLILLETLQSGCWVANLLKLKGVTEQSRTEKRQQL